MESDASYPIKVHGAMAQNGYPEAPELNNLLNWGRQASILGQSERAIGAFASAHRIALSKHQIAPAVEALYFLSREARFNNDFASSVNYANRILELGLPRDSELRFKGHLAIAQYYAHLADSQRVLSELERAILECEKFGIIDFADYLKIRATAEAALGCRSQSFANYDLAIEISQGHDAPDALCAKLSDAAVNTSAFGDCERARGLHTRAIRVASANELGFRLPLSLLTFAYTCLCFGDFGTAVELLKASESSPSNHLYVRFWRASVGLLLGVLRGDNWLISHFLDFGALTLALENGTSQRIGPQAAAICAYYNSVGESQKADDILLNALRAVPNPDGCWWMLLTAAKSQSTEIVQRALSLVRDSQSNYTLAHAHWLLLTGRLAQLRNQPVRATSMLLQAARGFESINWLYHHAVALELLGNITEARYRLSRLGATGAFRRIPKKKGRPRKEFKTEPKYREIAALVAHGATNRRISERLGIPERTVRYYITALFNEFGVSTRMELAEAFSNSLDG